MVTGQQKGVARMVPAMTKMADNKIESVVRRATSCIVLRCQPEKSQWTQCGSTVEKAEGDPRQNHQATESLCFFGQESSFVSLACEV